MWLSVPQLRFSLSELGTTIRSDAPVLAHLSDGQVLWVQTGCSCQSVLITSCRIASVLGLGKPSFGVSGGALAQRRCANSLTGRVLPESPSNMRRPRIVDGDAT